MEPFSAQLSRKSVAVGRAEAAGGDGDVGGIVQGPGWQVFLDDEGVRQAFRFGDHAVGLRDGVGGRE
jgi:hypothetical protein